MPNHNGTGYILLAIILLSLIGVGGAVAITIWGNPHLEDRALVYIGAVVVLGIKILLGIFADRKGKQEMVQEVSGVKKEVQGVARHVEEESVRLRQELDELQRGRGGPAGGSPPPERH